MSKQSDTDVFVPGSAVLLSRLKSYREVNGLTGTIHKVVDKQGDEPRYVVDLDIPPVNQPELRRVKVLKRNLSMKVDTRAKEWAKDRRATAFKSKKVWERQPSVIVPTASSSHPHRTNHLLRFERDPRLIPLVS